MRTRVLATAALALAIGPTQAGAATIKVVDQAGANAPSRDQRGVRRDSDPDSGAFER